MNEKDYNEIKKELLEDTTLTEQEKKLIDLDPRIKKIIILIEKKILSKIKKVIKKDEKYQKSKLTGNFEKDKPFKWRLEGYKYLKQELGIK